MKPIPRELLDAAEAAASVPVKKAGHYTAEICSAVADIKAADRMGKDATPAWQRLRETMDAAVATGDLSVLEDLQKSLKNLRVAATHIAFTMGNRREELSVGRILNAPLRPVTVALVKAIRDFQFDHNRAPDRQEILTGMNKILENGIDESELSRQLTRLGWNDLI